MTEQKNLPLSLELSPLQLKQIVFTRTRIETIADLNHAAELWAPKANLEGVAINTNVTVGTHNEDDPDDPRHFLVTVQLRVPNEEEPKAPYTIDLEATAFFELAPAYPPEERQAIVSVNGASMIIGAMREMISNVTSRSGFGPLLLPSLRFRPGEASASSRRKSKPPKKTKEK